MATLNTATLEALGLFRGDTIICRGKKRKDTVLIVLQSDDVDEGKVQLNKGMRGRHLAGLRRLLIA